MSPRRARTARRGGVDPDAAGYRPPGWLDVIVRFTAFALVSIGLVGVPLALAGALRPRYLAPAALLTFCGLGGLWLRGQRDATGRRGPSHRRDHLAAALAVLVAAGSVADNLASTAQHLLVDGDPAVYGVTGAILARTGGLTVPTHLHSLFASRTGLNFAGAGFFPSADGTRLYPQFFHLFPVLLAIAQWVDGIPGLLALNPVLAGVGLLAIYAFAARQMAPGWALLVMVTVAVLLPQVHFARDMFSEIPSQLLLFAGLSLLWDLTARQASIDPDRRPAVTPLGGAVVSGLVLGSSTMARVDAFFYLVPLAAGLLLLRAGRTGVVIVAAMLVPAVVAIVDGYLGSPAYLASTRGPLAESALALAGVGVAALYLHRRPSPRAAPLTAKAARPVALLTLLLAGYAWFIRPSVEISRDIPGRTNSIIAQLQRDEGLPVNVPRAYDEQTMHWLSWYLGPVGLALAVAAVAYLTYRVLRGRDLKLAPFVLLVLTVTAVYVWRPGIFPVQYWATRRFLPATFPGLLLLAYLVCHRAWAAGRRWAAGLAAVALLAFPVALLPTAALPQDYNGLLAGVQLMCGSLLPHDVVLLMGPPVAEGFPQTIEGFCGVPAASVGMATTPADVAAVVAAVHSAGRRLVLLSSQPQPPLAPAGATFRQLFDLSVPTQELSLSHRPDGVFPERVQLFLADLPPG